MLNVSVSNTCQCINRFSLRNPPVRLHSESAIFRGVRPRTADACHRSGMATRNPFSFTLFIARCLIWKQQVPEYCRFDSHTREKTTHLFLQHLLRFQTLIIRHYCIAFSLNRVINRTKSNTFRAEWSWNGINRWIVDSTRSKCYGEYAFARPN